ncbi:MAG: uroporphyrinogen decarboxylase family protein, partial [Bacillota bacterium]
AIESIGLERFCYYIYDDPAFVREVVERFCTWCATVIEYVNQLDFDFYWVNDDIADTHGPWFSPKVFRELFLPYIREVARCIKKPWIFHSDGNLMPLLDDLLTLGMNAIHPIQPRAMDIGEVKRCYGARLCLVGNIDLDYILTQASPDEVENSVKDTILTAGSGGGYIISSANSLTDYCKVENVLAFAQAVNKYGWYPLEGMR